MNTNTNTIAQQPLWSNEMDWTAALYKLRHAEHVKGEHGFSLRQQLSFSYLLIVATHGKGTLTLDTGEHRLSGATAYWCSPEQTFGIKAEDGDGLEVYLFHFDMYIEPSVSKGERLLHLIEEKRGEQEIAVHSPGETAMLCEAVMNSYASEQRAERFRRQIAFQELLYELMKEEAPPADGTDSAMDRAKEHMERHYGDSLMIDQLGKIAGVSPKYFVELFKKLYGISAIDYLTELRMNKAKQYLIQSNARLRDIAHQVGYQDEFYFSRKFKQQVGVSPSVYVKKRQRKIAAYGAWTTGHLLALNIIPYAAPLHPKWTAYYHNKYRNEIPVHLSAFKINEHWEANIEKLRQSVPDMIVSMDGLHPEERERLEQIGHVHYVPQADLNWRQQLKLTADYVGEAKEADEWLSSFDRQVHSVRERLRPIVHNDSFLIVKIHKGQLYAYCNRGITDIFYGELQMKPAYACASSAYSHKLTIEQLRMLQPDRLILNICHESETLAAWQQLRDSMEWQELDAVRSQKTYVIDSDPWREYSPIAHGRMVEDTLRLLSGNRP
ncbi:helix-turn-helix domain-containing protein [Paenibacillus sp. NPDC056579]|uniref:helix-turn-helix domain-containing protein n=1 Tax=Paenibacillus sp. NPDC056579 TaxID=3345871 RepID=UPI0036754979